jgi:hypothetical protein
MDYSGLLSKFLESILKEEGKCYSVIKDIVLNGCKKLPLDKDQSMYVYLFLSKYKSILHISQETLELIKGVVMEKFEQDQVYIINPSLDDLLENNVYKLLIGSSTYYVPLWHSELYFDNKEVEGGEIIVKCLPDLPQNMTINENNVLHIELSIPFSVSLLDDPVISFFLGKKEVRVPIQYKRIQSCFIPNCGVSNIDEKNIYNVEKQAGIFVKITFFS